LTPIFKCLNVYFKLKINTMFPSTKIIIITATLGIFLVFTESANASIIRKPPINLGLVGYWSFDTGKGGLSAHDQSGNGNTGTLTSMDAGSDWVDGKLGQALDFDGSDDYVAVPLVTTATQNLTITGWVYWRGTSANTILFYNGNTGSSGWGVLVNNGSCAAGNKITVLNGGVSCDRVSSTTILPTNSWTHIVLTRDSTTWRLYVDGVQKHTGTGNPNTPTAASNIGASHSGSSVFNGLIDEVRIYNRALSAAEVARLYRLTKPKILTPNNNGLVGYWSFNDGAGGYAGDMSGNGNTGTLTNMDSSTDWVPGKLGTALDFDGSNDYVKLTTGTGGVNGLGPGSATIAFWLYPRKTGDYMVSHQKNTWIGWLISTTAFTYSGQTGSNDSGCDFSGSIGLNQWKHVTVVVDRTDGFYRCYVDGIFRDDGSISHPAINSSSLVFLGARGSVPDNFRDIIIDEVRIYNRALSAAEVAGLYQQSGYAKINTSPRGQLTNGLVGYWTFDGPDLSFTTNLATDVSGNGNNGRLTNMSTTTAPAIGRLGQALNFDGSNDYVELGTSAANLAGASGLTLSAWVNTSEDYSVQGSILTRANSSVKQYALFISTDSNFSGWIASGGTGVASAVSATAVNVGQWYHVVYTYDGGNGKIYVNGILDGTSSGFTGGIQAATVNLRIGARLIPEDAFGHAFNGLIDEVRIYNRALSASEITRLYNMGR
jgi:hypothetical protein